MTFGHMQKDFRFAVRTHRRLGRPLNERADCFDASCHVCQAKRHSLVFYQDAATLT